VQVKKLGKLLQLVVGLGLCCAGLARAADWPTYRHDNARSGVTSEELRPPLRVLWTFHSPHPPARGWSDYRRNEDRIGYDDAFDVAAAGNAVYFASSPENKVYSLDAATGKTRWCTYTDAPPRLAPTAWQGSARTPAYKGYGGTSATIAAGCLWNGGAENMVGYDLETGQASFTWPGARHAVIHGGTAFVHCRGFGPYESKHSGHLSDVDAGYSEVLAIPTEAIPSIAEALLAVHTKLFRQRGPGPGRRENAKIDDALAAERQKVHEDLDRACRWRLPSGVLDCLILSGGVLFAGGTDEVIAVDAATGRKLWTGQVQGRARGLAVANGRLFVSTAAGNIHCFSAGTGAAIDRADPPPADKTDASDGFDAFYRKVAESIVVETGISRGYCLVLADGKGRLALELAARTDLRIHVLEPDPDRARAARSALSEAGVYGARVYVSRGSLSSLRHPPFFANLVVCAEAFFGGDISTSVPDLLRVLRPRGGVAYVGRPPQAEGLGEELDPHAVRAWLDELPGGDVAVYLDGA